MYAGVGVPDVCPADVYALCRGGVEGGVTTVVCILLSLLLCILLSLLLCILLLRRDHRSLYITVFTTVCTTVFTTVYTTTEA